MRTSAGLVRRLDREEALPLRLDDPFLMGRAGGLVDRDDRAVGRARIDGLEHHRPGAHRHDAMETPILRRGMGRGKSERQRGQSRKERFDHEGVDAG